MADQASVFDETKSKETNNNSTDNATSPTSSEPTASEIAELVGEGKKYKTIDDLAKAYKNADQFIEHIKTENQGLREELDKRLSANDVLEQLKREREESQSADAGSGDTTPSLSKEDLSELISNVLEEKDSQKTAQQNLATANDKMVEIYGDPQKAKAAMEAKASELGLSVGFLKQVAEQSPTAFFNSMGITGKSQTSGSSVTHGKTNTEALSVMNQSSNTTEGTWRYYEELRKSNPKQYWKPETQNRLFRDRQEKGESFFAT